MKFEILDINDAIVAYGEITVSPDDHWTDIERKKDVFVDEYGKKHNMFVWCKWEEIMDQSQKPEQQWAILAEDKRTAKNQVLNTPFVFGFRSNDKAEMIKIGNWLAETLHNETPIVKDGIWEFSNGYYKLIKV